MGTDPSLMEVMVAEFRRSFQTFRDPAAATAGPSSFVLQGPVRERMDMRGARAPMSGAGCGWAAPDRARGRA